MTPKESIIIKLVDQNIRSDDSLKCADMRCGGISCDECTIGAGLATTLGDVRKMDPRNKAVAVVEAESAPEVIYTGGSSSYYTVEVKNTTTPDAPAYTAECNDIIEALGMNFAEGNAFKALWRRAAQRTLGLRKAGAKDDGLYDAEKVEFFGARLVAQSKAGRHDSE